MCEAFKNLSLDELTSLVSAFNQAGIKLQKLFSLSLANGQDFSGKINLFIANQYDLNQSSSSFNSPLFQAINNNDPKSVNALLTHGANPNIILQDESPLLLAAHQGNLSIVTDLLAHGANPNFKRVDGCNPLFLAVKKGHTNIVKALIDHKVDPAAKVFNQSLLIPAIVCGNLEILTELLARGANPNNQRDPEGLTPLYLAAQNGKLKYAEKLVEHKAVPNIPLNSGKTPLMAAAEGNHTKIIELLLNQGAKINSVDKCGDSALHVAARKGHQHVVGILLKNKALINVKNNLGNTPLFLAVEEEHISTVKILARKVDVNEKFRGMSPLFKAVSLNNKEMVDLLLEAKADPSNGFIACRTPLTEAEKKGSTEIVTLLLSKNTCAPKPDQRMILSQSLPLLKPEKMIDIFLIEAWRLFIDGIKQKSDYGWIGFEKREVGYLEAMCKAMAFIMCHMDDELSVELIQNVHKIALNGVTNTLYARNIDLPGEIRKNRVFYGLSKGSVTKKGFSEIIKKMVNDESYLTLRYRDESLEVEPFITDTLNYISDEQVEQFIDNVYEEIQKGRSLKVEGLFDVNSEHSRDYYIKKRLISLIEQYDFEIVEANGVEEKILRAILSFVRSSQDMHVFRDGNGRTFYMIVFYFLLIKNNLPIPLLENVNDLMCHSVDELLILIKKGWQNKAILQKPTDKLFEISLLDILETITYDQLKYFVASLNSLKPFFISSSLFNLLEAIIEKQTDQVKSLIEKEESLLWGAYAVFLMLVTLPNPELLIDFKKNFPDLFNRFIHFRDTADAKQSPGCQEPAVIAAAKKDCAETLEILAMAGADLQKTNVLHTAAWKNSLKVIQLLVNPKFKVDANKIDSAGNTAVCYAACVKSIEALKLLVDAGADLNKTESATLDTPLHIAVKNQLLKSVTFLAQQGNKIDINKANRLGETAVFLAALYNYDDIFKQLISCGADLSIANNYEKYAPIHIAVKNNSIAVIQHIRDLVICKKYPFNINQVDNEGMTAAYHAALQNNDECLKLLVEAGADLQQPTKLGWVPLHTAIRNKAKKAISLLMHPKYKLDLNRTANYNETPAFVAAVYDDLDTLKALQEAGADLQKPDTAGVTPLMQAIINGNTECAKFLILNTNINVRTLEGHTAAYYAVRMKNLEILEMLIKMGIDLHLGKQGETPFFEAAMSDFVEGLHLMIQPEYKIDINQSFTLDDSEFNLATVAIGAAICNQTATLELLAEAKADLLKTTDNGNAPLHWAAYSDSDQAIPILLKYKVAIDLQNAKTGETAVFIAAAKNQLTALKKLADFKANLSLPDHNGMTPLQVAAKNGHIDIVRFLIQKNVDVLALDNEKHSAVYYAIQNKCWDVVKCLIQVLNLDLLSIEDRELIQSFKKEIIWCYYEASACSIKADRSPIVSMLLQNSLFFKKLNDDVLIENRHCSNESQREYDKTHGVVLYQSPKLFSA